MHSRKPAVIAPDGIITRHAWAALQHLLVDDDRITERAFCAALAERWVIALPVG